MIKRTLTGLILIAVVAGIFLLRNIDVRYFRLLILFLAVAGTFEITRAFKGGMTGFQRASALFFSIMLVPVYSFFATDGIVYLFVTVAILGLSGLIFDARAKAEGVGLMLFCMVYPALLLGFVLKINDFEVNSTIALLLLFLTVPAADTFAYIVGCSVKGKKLCPSVSPNKTISGGIGALIGGMAASLAVYFIFKDSLVYGGSLNAVVLFLIIGLLSAAIAVLGDLVESVIKRKAGIKDMGNILPGHGGVLDRIDGFIITAVFIFAVFELFIGI